MALLPANFRTTTALDNVSVRYANDQTKYIALQCFTPLVVTRNVGKFYIYDKQNMRLENLDAVSGTESKRFDYQATTASYTCKEKGAKHLVLGKDARDFDRPVADLRTDAAMSNMDKLLIEMEDLFHTKMTTTGNYPSGSTSALTNAWSGNAGDPIEDVRVARQAVFESCFLRPNCMMLSQRTLDYLKNHQAIVDRLKYVGLGAINSKEAVVSAIASLFEMQHVMVSDVAKLTSAEGATDASSSIWTSGVVICVHNPSLGLRTVTTGRTIIVNQLATKTINRPELARGDLGAEEIETSMEYTQEFIAQDSTGDTTAAYLYTGAY